MKPYLSLLQEVLDKGEKREDRTGVGTLSIFGAQRKFDLHEGFPLVTTKKVKIENILIELLWFLKGDT
ncbi:TPA: thymidylate synthase, partial [Patescibacteria group bacterium]|nr:thymidylate synthase [Patescibacteria group bacterium]